jgi:hypothetical protein
VTRSIGSGIWVTYLSGHYGLGEIIKLIVFRVSMQANMAGICICEPYRIDVGKGTK